MVRFKKARIFLILIIILGSLLRLVWLDSFPPSLYTDEANQGYNAYSILATGRDEHGQFLPVSLRSFGDWKPPLQTYLMIPFITLFGLNEYSVRLPSALLGTASILLTYGLILYILKDRKNKKKIALMTAFLISISPWHILQSRSAMLVAIFLFFIQFGFYLMLKTGKKNYYWGLLILFLSVYSYYGARLVAPLFFFWFYFKNRLYLEFKKTFYSFILIAIVLIPLFLAFLDNSEVLFGRARTVSVFHDQGVILRQWELNTQDGVLGNRLASRIYHNKPVLYLKNILSRVLEHFDGNYLFFKGDYSQPFQIPQMGILLMADIIFLPLGFLLFYKRESFKSAQNLITVWLCLSILPAALTFMTPSSNRTFTAVFVYSFITSVGLVYFSARSKPLVLFSIILYSISFIYFLNSYFIVLPDKNADWWGRRWKDTAVYLKNNPHPEKEKIVFFNNNEMAYIYLLFYLTYPPQDFQNKSLRDTSGDSFGFEHVQAFDRYVFMNDVRWREYGKSFSNALFIVPSEMTDELERGQHEIKYFFDQNGIKFFSSE